MFNLPERPIDPLEHELWLHYYSDTCAMSDSAFCVPLSEAHFVSDLRVSARGPSPYQSEPASRAQLHALYLSWGLPVEWVP